METLHLACCLNLRLRREFEIGETQFSDVEYGGVMMSAIYVPVRGRPGIYNSEMCLLSFNTRKEYEEFLRKTCTMPKKAGKRTTVYIAEEDTLSCFSEKGMAVGEEANFLMGLPTKNRSLGGKCKVMKSEKTTGGLYNTVLEPGSPDMKRRFLAAAHYNPMVWTEEDLGAAYKSFALKIGDDHYACFLKFNKI